MATAEERRRAAVRVQVGAAEGRALGLAAALKGRVGRAAGRLLE